MYDVDIIRCPAGEHRYAVLENESSEVVIFADDMSRFPSPDHLLQHYEEEMGYDAQLLSSGRIAIDYKSKTIRVWGCEKDRIEILSSLRWACPEFNVTEEG